jgi:hypothetical protein
MLRHEGRRRAVRGDLVQRGAAPDRGTGFTQLEVVMTKQEIDEMMQDLPSQRQWAYERSTRFVVDETLACIAFAAFVLILCFM